MRRVCVFCGSSVGARPEYREAARALARALTRRGIGLVYGGSRVGVMYEIAATALEAGGEVIGVIPQELVDKEVAFTGLSDLRIVGSMHERKALMAELSDGFIALPGGLGTIEELLEVLTWAQLGLHKKPCGLLNVCQYFDALVGFLDHAVGQRFIKPEHLGMLLIEEDPEALLARFGRYHAPSVDKTGWALGLAEGGS
ncbi:MAG TPA: TIGR00730 family Rossman fold protein [Candidatus Methylomirabilis sp.]